MATSYGLASFETRRTYDNMEQHVRDVLRGHFPQEDLVKKGEEVFELAEELTMYSLLKNSPNQAVSPDYYLKSMGVALGTACRIICDIPEGSFPEPPVKFALVGKYDPVKGGAPEHIKAKREAAEKEIEEKRKKDMEEAAELTARDMIPAQAQPYSKDEKGKGVAAVPAPRAPNLAAMSRGAMIPAQAQQSSFGQLEADSEEILRARLCVDKAKDEKKQDTQVTKPVEQVLNKLGNEKDAKERKEEIQMVRDHTGSVLKKFKAGPTRTEKLIAFVDEGCVALKHLKEADIIDVIRDYWENGTPYKGEEKEKTEAKDFARYFTKEEKKSRYISKARGMVIDVVGGEAPAFDVRKSKRVICLLKEVKDWRWEEILPRDEVVSYMFNTYKSLYAGETEQREAKLFKESYSSLKEKWEAERKGKKGPK